MSDLIEMRGLTKVYNAVTALYNVDLDMRADILLDSLDQTEVARPQ